MFIEESLTESGAHFYERAHDKDTHLNRSAAVKDGGGHDGNVFGEGIGQELAVLAASRL